MKRFSKLLLALAVPVLVTAHPTEARAVPEPWFAANQAMADPASIPADRSQFLASMVEELKTTAAGIGALNQRVLKIEPNAARTKADFDLATLRQKYEYTRDQLISLSAESGDAWDNAKASFVHVMQGLSDNYDDVDAEFTEDGV